MSKTITLTRRGETPNKVAAIKALRSLTGIGLREAKDAVDEVMDRGTATVETNNSLLDHSGSPLPEVRTLLGEGIYVGGVASKKISVLNAVRSSAKVAIDDGEYNLAISLIGVLKEHSNA